MKFEILDSKKHNRTNFNCGDNILNLYLQKFANQDQKRSLSKIYVLADNKKIIGFYTVSAHSVSKNSMPVNITSGNYNDLPFLLLGRLAVDKSYQGEGYGEALVYHACKVTMNAAEQIGIFGMIVEAKNDKVMEFYKKLGFKQLKNTQNRLVLSTAAITKIIEQCEN